MRRKRGKLAQSSEETIGLNRPRQQYHYLYGSTSGHNRGGGGDDDDDEDDVQLQQQPPEGGSSQRITGASSHSPSATDLDSLVGEALVQTDTEDDMSSYVAAQRSGSEGDFQQLWMTSNGNGGGIPTALTTKNGGRRRKEDRQQPAQQQHQQSSWRDRNSRFRRSHPVLYFVSLAGGVAAVLFLVTVVAFPNSQIALLVLPVSYDTGDYYSRHLKIPFPKVDRADYGDPVQNFVAADLLDPSFFSRGPTELREFVFPFPTGAFWTNLVLPPTADRGLSYPIAVYPYAFKWSDELLQVSYPAAHRVEEEKAIHDYFFPDLTLSVSESTQRRHLVYFDPLSVTLRWYFDNGGHLETYLVQGSPYVTVKYDNASPSIRAFSLFRGVVCPREDEKYQQEMMTEEKSGGGRRTARRRLSQRRRRLSFGICESVPDSDGALTYLRGVQFVLQTQEGMNWLLFASEPIEFTFDTQIRTTITSTSPFRGVLRLALIPSGSPGKTATSSSESTSVASATASSSGSDSNASASQIAASNGLQRLIYHAGIYPTRGDFSWTTRPSDSAVAGLKSVAKSLSGAMSAAAGSIVSRAGEDDSPMLMGSIGSTSASTSGDVPIAGSPSSTSSSSSSSGRVATITFQFATATFSPETSSGTNQKSLLMLALPHHAQSLPSTMQLGSDQFDLQYRCIKGPMQPVLGSSWSYDEDLPPVGFEVVENKQQQQIRQQTLLKPAVRSSLISSLTGDIDLALPTLDENVYGFGKQVARLAQLAHIAHELKLGLNRITSTAPNDTSREGMVSDAKALSDTFDSAIGRLRPALEHFLTNNVADYLVYDGNLGGIVTINGLRSKDADFGNGRYNDHHFHYGYILYASAIMGRIDSTFVQSYGSAVDSIYFDVANDSNFVSQKTRGIYYPAARHKSWFDGHSFASGLFPFGNGKSQESSSEAVNCYYGALLWSLVRHGAAEDPLLDTSYQTDFARLLLATEIRGAQMYWHMHPPIQSNKTELVKTPIYSPTFSENYMVGNLGMLDAVASTWFGTESLYVHMINEIPVTAITGQLFAKSYVQKEYENILKPLGEVETAWQGYLVCNHAIVDPNVAWDDAQSLFSPELDSALSKSQVLYWVATRPDFIAPAESPAVSSHVEKSASTSIQPKKSETHDLGASSLCSEHNACSRTGLSGACCPTAEGIFLDCCNS
jgi:endoglucanase Acf2